MATLIANQPLNMNAGLRVLDDDAAVMELLDVSPGATHQFWNMGSAGGLEVDLHADVGGSSFSVGFDRMALHTSGTDPNSPTRWTLDDLALDVNGSVAIDSYGYATVAMAIPGMWEGVMVLGYPSLNLISFDETYLASYDSFVEYALRRGDTITGSAGNDTLLGYGGKDRINGGGGADNLNGGEGSDQVKGGAGNDKITWGSGDAVDGGAGTDTLKIKSGDLSLVPLTNKVLGIEHVDLRGGASSTLTLNRADVLEMSSTTNNIRIFGDAADRVDIVGKFTPGTPVAGFTTYDLGRGALLTIETDVAVS